jgi:hypothetical protein
MYTKVHKVKFLTQFNSGRFKNASNAKIGVVNTHSDALLLRRLYLVAQDGCIFEQLELNEHCQ